MGWTHGTAPPPIPPGEDVPPSVSSPRRSVAVLSGALAVVVGVGIAGGALVGHHLPGGSAARAARLTPISTLTPAPSLSPSPSPTDPSDPATPTGAASTGCAAPPANHAAPPPALFTGNASGPVITPDQATQAVTTFWPLREQALVANDRTATDALEAGPAAEFDDAESCSISLAHDSARVVRPFTQIHVFVPVQTAYPARFLAEVLSTVYPNPNGESPPGTPYVEFFVFVRPDPLSPWKAVLNTGGGNGLDTVVTLPGSFDADPPRPSWVDPSGVPTDLAAYWQHWKDFGSPPADTLFAPGRWTTVQGETLESRKVVGLSRGVADHVTYSADPATDGLYQFAVDQDVDLECFTVRYHSVLTPVYWALHQDNARGNYGGLLPPGDYTSIEEHGLHESCAFIAPTRSQTINPLGSGIGIAGGEGGEVSIQGVLTPPPPTPRPTPIWPTRTPGGNTA